MSAATLSAATLGAATLGAATLGGTTLGTAPSSAAPQRPAEVADWRACVGLFGVLLGAMMATLGTRVSTFGLADVRGALDAGFDEGAWITTAIGVGQIVSGVTCAYLASIVGARRLLLVGIATFFAASVVAPLSPNLTAYLTAQVFAGLGSGTFIPLAIVFILRNLPQRFKLYGIAIYALNLEFSLNIGASLEGYYTEHWSWHWNHWQYCVMLPLMALCIFIGMPAERFDPAKLRTSDGPGLAYASISFATLYAALDQGNRLGWWDSGLVWALVVCGCLALVAFLVREFTHERPYLELRLLWRRWLFLLFMLLIGFRFIILSTAYILPTYLVVVQNFRGLDIGSVLIWIALPQFLIVIPLAILLKHVDARWTLGVGAATIALACLMATGLTDDWASSDFLPSQLLQAVGQSMALTSLLVLITSRINPAEAVTIGAFIQFGRLFGGEFGVAVMETVGRTREQLHSNLLGLHVEAMAGDTAARLTHYTQAIAGQVSDPALQAAEALALLSKAVARQAAVLSYVDSFQLTAAVALICFILAALTHAKRA